MKTDHFATESIIISTKVVLHNSIHYRSGMFHRGKVAGQWYAGKKYSKF